ncbi:DUF2059 domain-containing protein [Alteromonas oceanisediminis]|uniref:DUF2059 domain-containing protein n=1 Tax=Alteromonas oceanisediminis TaxID=2836180 RepID=UPI001BDB3F0D|nr:DUF2059 domain-containing protein [Alteromonas oceanisediminis]MBT0587668.1 hypothetical protein [Alteromonas oceanisediminis]
MRLVLFFLFFINANSFANPLVHELLEVNGMKESFAQYEGKMTDILIMSDPSLEPHRSTIEKWEQKYYSWVPVRNNMTPIYSQKFNQQELNELIRYFKNGAPSSFLETQTGKKYQDLRPEIDKEMIEYGHQYMTKIRPYLTQMIEDTKPS